MINYPTFFRPPWNKEKVDTLIEFWPHWGTDVVAQIIGVTNQQAKAKVDKLKLHILPKNKRKCLTCKINYQSNRRYGLNCKACGLIHRKEIRALTKKPRVIWMGDILRTLRYRSKEPCNLTLQDLMSAWDNQDGKCFYSNYELREPIFDGRGRSYKAASVDRIDSKRGYIKGNIVWCCWGCNIAKQNFDIEEFIENCKIISDNADNIRKKLKNLLS